MKKKAMLITIFIALLILTMPMISNIQAESKTEKENVQTNGRHGPPPCSLWCFCLSLPDGGTIVSPGFILSVFIEAFVYIFYPEVKYFSSAYWWLRENCHCDICA